MDTLDMQNVITWDERKNRAHFKKHGIWFEEAMTVLMNPLTLSNLNDHPDGNRHEHLGRSLKAKLLYVVTVENTDDHIRIVSARPASFRERRLYEEGI